MVEQWWKEKCVDNLTYTDNVAIVAKTEKEMEMIKQMKIYVDRKELEINTQKTKVIIFKQGESCGNREKRLKQSNNGSIWKYG